VNGDLQIIRYFCERCGVFPDLDILIPSAKNGHLIVIKFLFKVCKIHHKTFAASFISRAITAASEDGHFLVVQYLVKKCSKSVIELNNGVALWYAIHGGYLNIVKCLCEKGADVNHETRKGSCFKEACRKGDLKIVEYLCEMGAKIDDNSLIIASEYSHVVKYLIMEGGNLKALCPSYQERYAIFVHAKLMVFYSSTIS
jgi:hypothetical protein